MEFLWHDYETFGTEPAVDRPCQFAAQRTDRGLNPVGDAVVMYCAPADDVLPHPEACLVTGITPQEAKRKGLVEAEFAEKIAELMMVPHTCSAGYNNIRFDDEVTRHLFYRNLMDPYEREWRNGNSRWDLINLARMCYALRPEGIEWPMVRSAPDIAGDESAEEHRDAPMRPSFRLEDLAKANGIEHGRAHDALADVHATIDLARLLERAQPRLFEWSLRLRSQKAAWKLLDPDTPRPLLHTSGRISAARGCTSMVLPLARHPDYDKSVIVFDLMGDAVALEDLDAAEIADRVFTPIADLPEGVERLPLKAIKSNAVPMIAPASVLEGVDPERIGLDRSRCARNAQYLSARLHTVRRKLSEVFHREPEAGGTDPDFAIYSGGFFPDADRRLMKKIHQLPPADLAGRSWPFQDARLPLMLLRYRARNWPDTLDPQEWQAWQRDRLGRLQQPPGAAWYTLEAFENDLARARTVHKGAPEKTQTLDRLEAWAIEIGLRD